MISKRSMSSLRHAGLAAAPSVTSTGPVSISARSEPIEAKARIRARGFRPRLRPPRFEPTSTAAAPSTMPEELPAWWTWLTRLDIGMRRDRDRVEAAHLAHLHEGGLELRRATACRSRAACARRWSRIVRPLTSFTGTTDFAKPPFLPGLRGALLRLDRIGVDIVAREAVFGRDEIGRDALRQEVVGDRDAGIDRPGAAGGAHADAATWIRRRRRWRCPSCPAMTCAAARFTASRPEAQKRLICTPGTSLPKPALSTAARAMSPPASPTGSTQPSTTSSTSMRVEVVALADRVAAP